MHLQTCVLNRLAHRFGESRPPENENADFGRQAVNRLSLKCPENMGFLTGNDRPENVCRKWVGRGQGAGIQPSPAYVRIAGKINVGKKLSDTAESTQPESEWGSHAAAMARIVLQRPVRMLVHASAMLP